MSVPRTGPYVWVTYLPGLMLGSDNCEWKAWFKTHHEDWDKVPKDWSEYSMRHTRMLRELRREVAASGAEVFTEKQVEFLYRHPSGLVLSGRPDLVAINGDAAVVYDTKTGRPWGTHAIQVKLYMMFLAELNPLFADKTITGQVVYEDHHEDIPADAISDEFRATLDYWLDILESPDPADRVPSQRECDFCDIAKSECPDRIE